MPVWRYEQCRKERLARVYVCICVCVNTRVRVDEKEERWWGRGVVEERRRLLLLSLFEQTRSFTSVTRREPDIMPLMSAPADSTIDVTLRKFSFRHFTTENFPFPSPSYNPAEKIRDLKIIRLTLGWKLNM